MIIAISGQKGGVGKSTIAISLAVEAMQRGHEVLLVDAVPQSTSRTWGEVAEETNNPSPTVVSMGATMHHEGQLPKISKSFDLTIIDCPPRHNDVQRSALVIANKVVIPCGPSPSDAWALSATVDLINEARILRPDLDASIVITRKKKNTAIGAAAREVLSESGLQVLTSELHDRISYQEALAAGQGVSNYESRGPAASEIRSLFDEIVSNGQEKE